MAILLPGPYSSDGLETKEIIAGVDYIATWLDDERPGKDFEIVVAGGTVSVLLFKNRDKTKDVDIFSPDDTVLRDVLQAGREYTRENRLPTSWINAEIVAHINGLHHNDRLLSNSITQGVVIYRYSAFGLVVYAAN
ncbi:hypothetical protein DFH09DRAFT_1416785 [Mycena vulgaris]|nr:hypothetical protein DFH09DRAFT_1416785 [Mycena vulgaris]